MFDAGALIFKLQTIGAKVFQRDQADAKQAVEKTGQAASKSAADVDRLGKSTDETGKKSRLSKKPLTEQAKATEEVGEQSRKAAPKQDEQRKATEAQIESAKKLSVAMLVAGTAVAAMVSLSVVKHTEFDAQMSNVRASTMSTAEEQRDLGEAALEAGANTAYSATEAAAAEEELAKAGQSVAQVVGGSLNGALALAAAGQLQVARSAEIMATTLTQFRIPAEQAAHVSDVLAAGAGKAQGSVDDLALALSYVGPLAGSVGFSLNETAGTIAYFATQGIIGEKAGTSLRGVLASLQAPSALADKEMKNYNISMFDAHGNMLSIAGIAEQLRTRLSGLTEQERLAALGRIFGNESLSAATLLYEGGAAEVEKWTAAVDDSGYAARQAAIRQDNLAGDVEKLGGAFETALIRSGTAANDVLRGMVQAVTQLVDMYGDAPEPVQATATAIGIAAAAILLSSGFAVGARAKFLELKTALDLTSTSMGKTALIGGAVGIALTGIITVVGLLMVKQAEARQKAQAYADTLEEGTHQITRATRDMVKENLAAADSFLWVNNTSAFDKAEELGLSLGRITDAAMGNVDALKELKAAQEGYQAAADAAKRKGDDNGIEAMRLQDINAVIDAVNGESDSIEESIRVSEQKQDADQAAADSSQTAAEAYIAEADSVEDLNAKLTDLIDTINEANGVGQDAVTANIDYQNTLSKVDEQVQKIRDGIEGYGAGLDKSTQAGRDNTDMLVKLAQDSQEAAEAQLELDGNTQTYLASLEEGRQRLIDSAIAMGASEEAAILLADSIYRIPTEREIEIIADTETAEVKLQRIKDRLDAIPGFRSVTLETIEIGNKTVSGSNFADGGVVRFNAAGNVYRSEHHIAEIARGGDVRVWNEPETEGETYLPHAMSKRARSEQLLAETATIFGGTYIPAGASTRSFADGGVANSAAPSLTTPIHIYGAGLSDAEVRSLIREEFRTMVGSVFGGR